VGTGLHASSVSLGGQESTPSREEELLALKRGNIACTKERILLNLERRALPSNINMKCYRYFGFSF